MIRKNDVKVGDTIITENDFGCMKAGEEKVVKKDPTSGDLYVDCIAGQHCLDGQEEVYYVGFKPKLERG